jgi:HD superfamily phosphohydrolase YqeK
MQWLRLAELREIPMTAEEELAPVLFHGPWLQNILKFTLGCRQADVLAAIYYHTRVIEIWIRSAKLFL